MIIPRIRSTGSKEIETRNLKEALEIWSSIRESANEMRAISDNWASIHNSLPSDIPPLQQEVELKEFYHDAGMTIGKISKKMLEKILEEINECINT
jgi:uncharacterized protein YabN with tetrapyrrole methylase and pyrophosphatase domain